jgi:CheY-like chemotaxis protein
VAKILVADDNSNIQKMVGLALKDQGIDVVAVGNGEAAVRKISDVHPDLVLADVFMPVRNGYEVCQYVKEDSALSHIPVILLVGAFDPLDEQEAQRVGADGVLKKPFVPPDPLISMVKSALARAGVPFPAAASENARAAESEPLHAADILTPRTGSLPPTLAEIPSLNSFETPLPSAESEPSPEETPSRPAPVQIGTGSQPLAFGNLLDSPAAEEQDDSAFQTTRTGMGLERDWREGDEEELDEEDEESSKSAWRPDTADEEFGEKDTPATVSETAGRRRERQAWSPQTEKTGFVEAATPEESVGAALIGTPAAGAKAPIPEAPFSGDAWAAAISEGSEAKARAEREKASGERVAAEASAPAAVVPAAPTAVAIEVPSSVTAELKAAETEKPQPESPWYSAVSSPWDAEVQKASKLASTWDAPVATAERAKENGSIAAGTKELVAKEKTPAAESSSEAPTHYASETILEHAEQAGLPAATVEAIREEAAQLTESVTQKSTTSKSGQEAAKSGEPGMDDVVAKVLAKMSPEMLQAVTREILKPVVEAIVRQELNAKKP